VSRGSGRGTLTTVALSRIRLAERTGDAVDFVEAEVYDAPRVLGRERFDLVYTGVGALCWLPSVRRWGEVVAELLRPGRRLFIREGHPMLWVLDDRRRDGLLVVDYPYFERQEPLVEEASGTYVQTAATFSDSVHHLWNHGLGEIVTALLDAGMELIALTEHDSVPWEALPERMEQIDGGEWRVRDRPWRVPHSYTLQAVRRDR
jgi:SAM-dependent methyltransferase